MNSRICELCSGEASLYCDSDSAFLCFGCDARVHDANFLVAKHVRQTVCCTCKGFDGKIVSGVGFRPVQSFCKNCEAEDRYSGSGASSSSSACISSAESFTATPATRKICGDRKKSGGISRSDSVSEISVDECANRMATRANVSAKRTEGNTDAMAEGILVIWSRNLGLRVGCSVALALYAYGVCLQKFTSLPLRVSLASSLLFAANRCEPRGLSTCQLKKLQQCSRVPAKLILLVESKLTKKSSQEEGWAECPDHGHV